MDLRTAREMLVSAAPHDLTPLAQEALSTVLRALRDAERRADKLHDAFVDSNGREPDALDLGKEMA